MGYWMFEMIQRIFKEFCQDSRVLLGAEVGGGGGGGGEGGIRWNADVILWNSFGSNPIIRVSTRF